MVKYIFNIYIIYFLSLIICGCWNGRGKPPIASALTRVDPSEYKKYTKANFDYGKVVIVLSRGRSGSSFLCRLIENIEGEAARIQDGLFGGHSAEMEQVQNATLLLMTQLQRRRSTHPEGQLIGIKWKPYVLSPTYLELFGFLSRMSFPVVYMHRNPLDEYISRTKHKRDNDLDSHCRTTACATNAQHERVTLDVTDLPKQLLELSQQVITIRNLLDSYKVKYLEMKYEDLAFGDNGSRKKYLQRVIDFLELDKRARMKYFQTEIISTNSYNQSLIVENYDEVQAVVRSMWMSDLLHP